MCLLRPAWIHRSALRPSPSSCALFEQNLRRANTAHSKTQPRNQREQGVSGSVTPTDWLPHPDAQPYLPRLSGAGSLRRELEAVLDTPSAADSTLHGFRDLILQQNAAGKHSASMRLWTWKRLKVRYLLDPRVPEFRAFQSAMTSSKDPAERGLLAMLMMARTDRLFREVTTQGVSIHLRRPGSTIDPSAIRSFVDLAGSPAQTSWTKSVIEGLTSHILSSCKDFGLLEGSRVKRTLPIRVGPTALAYAVRLSRFEGLTDRRTLESRWFRLLGLYFQDVLELMYRAAGQGVLQFRFQADVTEIVLPDAVGVNA
jgi:hypothetical protein